MQVYTTIKICFLDIFWSGGLITAHELSFWSLWSQDLFHEKFWRSNSQNYSLALEICDGNDMQCNACEVKWEAQNRVSTSSNPKIESCYPNQIQIAAPPSEESFWQTNSKPLHSCEDRRPKPQIFMWYCLFIRLQYIYSLMNKEYNSW